jgi:hypothetical protein
MGRHRSSVVAPAPTGVGASAALEGGGLPPAARLPAAPLPAPPLPSSSAPVTIAAPSRPPPPARAAAAAAPAAPAFSAAASAKEVEEAVAAVAVLGQEGGSEVAARRALLVISAAARAAVARAAADGTLASGASPPLLVTLGEAGGVVFTLAALMRHLKARPLLVEALKALAALTATCGENRDRFILFNGLRKMDRLLKTHPLESDLVAAVCAVRYGVMAPAFHPALRLIPLCLSGAAFPPRWLGWYTWLATPSHYHMLTAAAREDRAAGGGLVGAEPAAGLAGAAPSALFVTASAAPPASAGGRGSVAATAEEEAHAQPERKRKTQQRRRGSLCALPEGGSGATGAAGATAAGSEEGEGQAQVSALPTLPDDAHFVAMEENPAPVAFLGVRAAAAAAAATAAAEEAEAAALALALTPPPTPSPSSRLAAKYTWRRDTLTALPCDLLQTMKEAADRGGVGKEHRASLTEAALAKATAAAAKAEAAAAAAAAEAALAEARSRRSSLMGLRRRLSSGAGGQGAAVGYAVGGGGGSVPVVGSAPNQAPVPAAVPSTSSRRVSFAALATTAPAAPAVSGTRAAARAAPLPHLHTRRTSDPLGAAGEGDHHRHHGEWAVPGKPPTPPPQRLAVAAGGRTASLSRLLKAGEEAMAAGPPLRPVRAPNGSGRQRGELGPEPDADGGARPSPVMAAYHSYNMQLNKSTSLHRGVPRGRRHSAVV